jgi:drug/metabolite transporter (DMT)-like permease
LFAAMTAGPQFLGHTVFNHLLGEVKASVVSVALLAEPVGATLLGLLVFHERPGPQVVAGAAVVLAGVAVTVFAESSARPEVLASGEG